METRYKIIEPSNSKELEGYFFVRWQVLREPWKQPEGSEKDELENSSIHVCALTDEGNIIGVARSNKVNNITAQIRYMAVLPKLRNHRIGESLLSYLELKAQKEGIKKIILHAREDALGFYRKNGYTAKEKSHLLYGSIQHYLMEKILD